jgi:SAM-dependent methyltransferase
MLLHKDVAKTVARAILPLRARNRIRRSAVSLIRPEKEFEGLSNKDVFEKIYREKRWGVNPSEDRDFCSGSGSHNSEITSGYVKHVRNFLGSFDEPKLLVDLGCGDFNVGSQIAPFASDYIACDLVYDVIEENRKRFKIDNVQFRVLDLANDALPSGDIVFVRQVLQHLSNQNIKKFCGKIANYCSTLILTEHLPATKTFKANIDKPNGPQTRLMFDSGVVLTDPPFGLKCKSEKILCEYPEQGGIIRTTVFTF